MRVTNAWVSGFFDGEGCVSITKRQRTKGFVEHWIALQVGQMDRKPLDAIQRRFGGSVCPSRTPSGCYRWRCHAKRAERFLRAILPYSIVKREQIKLALELRALIGRPGKRVLPGVWVKKEAVYRRFRRTRECGST